MKLTNQEKRELRMDARDPKRRRHFRLDRSIRHPKSFEEYLKALDDLQLMQPAPPRRSFITYTNVKL